MDGRNGLTERGTTDSLAIGLTSCLECCEVGFARSVFAADVDGDGDIDVLSASRYDDKIAWYENDGSETFTAHTITTTADEAFSVFAADVDGDGDMDVLSASINDDKIAWYENDGSESFTAHTITTTANGAVSVFAADVDGDGDLGLGERLLMLDSSKIIATLDGDDAEEHFSGDIIHTEPDDDGHGTAVSGILVGEYLGSR